jgi:hypothetical protein
VDRTLRRAAPAPAPVPDEAETWRARLAGLSDAVDMDELRSMEADARRLVADAQRAAAALGPADVPRDSGAPPAEEEDKHPRRRTFFER